MADRLSRIIGTEEDKVNCPFYFKIGACRHGDRCSRNHLRPHFSQTLLIPHLYVPPIPPGQEGQPPPDDTEHFEEFYEEILEEFGKFGELEHLHVVENLGDHMFGNVYVKFATEEMAEACLTAMSGRYYAGRLVAPEYSPVSDFSEARCRQFDEDHCLREGYCNFMHLRRIPRFLRKMLRDSRKKSKKSSRRSRSRSRSRDRGRRSSRSRSRGRGGGGRRSRSRSRGRDEKRRSRSRSPAAKKDDLARSGSAERRAKIAEWNKAKAPA